MSYEVTLKTNVVEVIAGADAYVQEGPLTTFFEGRDGRTVLDTWTRRLASFRTADIVSVRWVASADDAVGPLEPLEALRWAV
ncbi:MAG TPA: hypothetical protein VN786_03680 [Acidimicrobiales bacterium]|nr:hypothetical protein [Acidimicrobiales bacterium]